MNIHSFCLTAHNSNQIKQLDFNQLNQQFSNDSTQVEFIPLYESNALSVSIKGQHSACLNTRGIILRNNPAKVI